LSLAVTSNTFTAGLPVSVLRPDGIELSGKTTYFTDQMDLPKLPISGTYRIRVNPDLGGSGVGTGSVALTLSTAVTRSISVGSSTTISTTRPAQDAYLDFQGTTGQLLRVGLSFNTMANHIAVTVYNPSGSTLKSGSVGITGSIDLPALPAAGTYRIRLDPEMIPNLGQGTVSVSVSLSNR
jgi:large repetitive protein